MQLFCLLMRVCFFYNGNSVKIFCVQSTLSSAQIEQFLARGFLKIEGAVARDVALEWGARGWNRIGADADDVATWTRERHHLPYENRFSVREHAPAAYEAAAQLAGADWNCPDWDWGDAFIFNLGDKSGAPWQAPADLERGWHSDGDFFQHYLDSPEQALLTIVLWTDVKPYGGATYLACDSVGVMARYLAAHPEGVAPNGFPFLELKNQCHDFEEATGRAGDVFLMHPLLLHSASRNQTRAQRIISNPVSYLKLPMNFNRENPANFSLVERAVLKGLGVEKYNFQPTGSRERIVPQREINERKMKARSVA